MGKDNMENLSINIMEDKDSMRLRAEIFPFDSQRDSLFVQSNVNDNKEKFFCQL